MRQLRVRAHSPLVPFALAVALACGAASRVLAQQTVLTNPYAGVAWSEVVHARADLHVHTIQSDGCQLPEEVVTAYHDAGFAILAITDHDTVSPNLCPPRENASPQLLEAGIFATRRSPYPDPRPVNFPANPTWPWTDFGAPSPDEIGMVGIPAVELTCGHHRSAYFVEYGVAQCGNTPTIGEQLDEVGRLGGLAIINHPEPRFNEWYRELYRSHPVRELVGIELSTGVDDSLTLWDQLLASLMPSRPVWGLATSDMHYFPQTKFAFTVFLLDELTVDAVREAMQAGRFYAVVGPGMLDLRDARPATYQGTYAQLRSISVDSEAGTIAVDATDYDEIVWLSKPPPGGFRIDPETGISWPAGEIVARGPVFDYGNVLDLPYVRAELIRNSADGPVRVFLNPFALAQR